MNEHAVSKAFWNGKNSDSGADQWPDMVDLSGSADTIRDNWMQYLQKYEDKLLRDYEFSLGSGGPASENYTALYYDRSQNSTPDGEYPVTPQPYKEGSGPRGLEMGQTQNIDIHMDGDSTVQGGLDSAKIGLRLGGTLVDSTTVDVQTKLSSNLSGGTFSADIAVPDQSTVKNKVGSKQKNANGNLYTWPKAQYYTNADPGNADVSTAQDVKGARAELVIEYTHDPGSGSVTKTSVVTDFAVMTPTSN